MTRSGHDQYTPAIELMDAWWPKLLSAEFRPMLGSAALGAVEKMNPFGSTVLMGAEDTSFADGWYGYTSKDLRRLFRIGRERGGYSRIYCGNLRGRRFSMRTLQRRCRSALQSTLAAALRVTSQQLYGSVTGCDKDPEPACADQNTFTEASAITIPPFPLQNRPTFQQVIQLTRPAPR
jgi:hypothetical protein